jgi:two-component system, NarL family, invasion response regulator UvrY
MGTKESCNVNVLIADDHPLVRRGLIDALMAHGGITVCGQARDSAEALALALSSGADVMVLDIAMPGRGGLEVLKEIVKHRPGLPVLVLSMYAETQFAIRALRNGAKGYLTKDADTSTIIEALHRLAGGGTCVPATLADQLGRRVAHRESDEPTALLSERELQVLRRLAEGRLVSEIADECALSIKSVSTYRRRMLDKLGARTTADLVRQAVESGLV